MGQAGTRFENTGARFSNSDPTDRQFATVPSPDS